jgi:ABC-2 type transport system permease protein
MNEIAPPLLPEAVPSPEKVLRRLFLTMFLRGRNARGLKKETAPKTVGEKLALTLGFYLLFGAMSLFFLRQPVFALAAYLHAMTFVFLGMFIASSAGEILFNKEEADILLHRPISPKTMLWAKIRVLLEVSLWLAFAFNLIGLFVGLNHGGWRFPVIHIVSTTLEALFCSGCIVLVYQLCLRWFGRERLEGLMTMTQVLVSIGAVLSGQILPRLLVRLDHVLDVSETSWWIALLPPAWFAGLDDAVAGTAQWISWLLAAIAVIATALVLWLAIVKLARDYELGLQTLNETVSLRSKKSGERRRWLDTLVNLPPLSWWLRDPVSRASFLLTAAYLVRDRDVKLRIYPSLAPMMILPFVFLLQGRNQHNADESGFGVPFSAAYLGLVPLLGLQILQYSQQWQAADIFRSAPMIGPAAICHGARRAVLCLLALPMMLLVAALVWFIQGSPNQLLLFLPGMIVLPIFALVPNLGGRGVLLSMPTDAAKATGRGLNMIVVMIITFMLAGATSWAWNHGWFWPFVGAEALMATLIYILLRSQIAQTRWPSLE